MPPRCCTRRTYNPYFRTNRKVFRATDFIAELLQHLPDPRLRLIRRYGLYSSRSRGTALRKPHLVRLAPEGWRQKHVVQEGLRIVAVITEPQQVRKIQTTEGCLFT